MYMYACVFVCAGVFLICVCVLQCAGRCSVLRVLQVCHRCVAGLLKYYHLVFSNNCEVRVSSVLHVCSSVLQFVFASFSRLRYAL